MRDSFKPYFNEYNLLGPHGMNDIVYTTQFEVLDKEGFEYTESLIKYHFQNGSWVNSDKSAVISHDNFTALVCLNKFSDFEGLPFKPEHCYLHPRDFVFYAWQSNNKFWSFIGFILLWVTTLCMIESILIDTYKNIDGDQVLETDGVLLSWLRINTTNMPVSKIILNILVRTKGRKWSDYFNVYFKDSKHPNRVLIQEKENA